MYPLPIGEFQTQDFKQTKSVLFLSSILLAFLSFVGSARADVFVDNQVSCNNGSTYNPTTRLCTGGNHKVYTTLNNAYSGIGTPAMESERVTINIRSGSYHERLYITKDFTTWQKYPQDNEKPLIDGKWSLPLIYQGLFQLNRADHVVIDGLHFYRAGYQGTAEGHAPDYNTQAFGLRSDNSSSITIQNCDFTEIGDGAIMVIGPSTGNMIQNNYFHHVGYAGPSGRWSPCVALHTDQLGNGVTYSTVRRNRLDGVWAEGISTDEDCHDNTIEYNTLINVTRVGLYLVCSYAETARYNFIYNTRPDGFECSAWSCTGIRVSCEDPGEADTTGKNHKIHGNLVAGMGISLHLEMYPKCTSCQISGTKIFNNTFVESVRTVGDWDEKPTHLYINGANVIGAGVEVKNNVFWQTTGLLVDGVELSEIEFDNNLYNKAPVSAVRSSSDPTFHINYPSLTISDYFQKQSGWTSFASLTPDDFALRSTATHGIDKGANLGIPYNSDYFGGTQSGAWDIGALVYGSSSSKCGNLVCDSGESYLTCPADCPNGTIIDSANWTCTADSEEPSEIDGPCRNAFDIDINTSWHTAWTSSSPLQPHNIDINLHRMYRISGLRYIPRQVDNSNGIVTRYEVYSSYDGIAWTLVTSGTWTYTGKEAKDIEISTTASYLRFKSLDDNSHHWTSAAEILVLGEADDTKTPSAPGGLSLR